MRTVWMRWACLLAAFANASVLAGEEDQRDAKQSSAPVILGGVTPRIIIGEEEEELLGVPVESTKKPEGQIIAKSEQDATFVVTCKLNHPQQENPLVVVAIAPGKQTEIPVRFRAKIENGVEKLVADKNSIAVPGKAAPESVRLGHQIHVKIDPSQGKRVRLDAAVEYRGLEREGEGEPRVADQNGRYVGEVAFGKPVSVVLETNDDGEPKHWVEFIVRLADEEADEEVQAASKTYSVVYSVAGLVGVEKKSKPGKRPELDFAPLIKKIEKKVSPESWAAAGGEGKIQSFARTSSLVVVQTEAVHAELAAFLNRLQEDEEAIQEAILVRQ